MQVLCSSKTPTVCHGTDNKGPTFRITHPFHPLVGQEFALSARQHLWSEKRAVYFDGNGNLRFIAISWTDLAEQDLFQLTASGSSSFRFDDLLALAELVSKLSETRKSKPWGVERFMP